MRKNNDGYVIIYVIFVILFLCIVAIGTTSSALSNLQSQNKAVEQMKVRYAAEGEIEKKVAEMCVYLSNNVTGVVENVELQDNTAVGEIVHNDIIFKGVLDANEYLVWDPDVANVMLLTQDLAADGISAKVQFRIPLLITTTTNEDDSEEELEPETPEDEESETDEEVTYTIEYKVVDVAKVTSKYLSYSIETTGGAA